MHPSIPHLLRRTYVGIIVYLLGFAILLYLVSHYYLLPAMAATKGATPAEKRVLVAHSRLILALFLFILLTGLVLVFRVGRFFFPRHIHRQKPTVYPDAWEEAGRRMEVDGSTT